MPQQVVLNTVPGTLVAGFLLTPEYIFSVRVAVNLNLEIIMRKRVQLLDPNNCDILDSLFPAISQQFVIYLAAAGDDAPYVLRIELFHFRNHVLETAIGQIFET